MKYCRDRKVVKRQKEFKNVVFGKEVYGIHEAHYGATIKYIRIILQYINLLYTILKQYVKVNIKAIYQKFGGSIPFKLGNSAKNCQWSQLSCERNENPMQ